MERLLLPFCADFADVPNIEVDVNYHSNVRGPGTVFDELRSFRPASIAMGGVNFRGFQEILAVLLVMIFRLSEQTAREVDEVICACDPPKRYASIHIRRGDKVGDEDDHYATDIYLDRLDKRGASCLPLFILSDDSEFRRNLADRARLTPVTTRD